MNRHAPGEGLLKIAFPATSEQLGPNAHTYPECDTLMVVFPIPVPQLRPGKMSGSVSMESMFPSIREDLELVIAHKLCIEKPDTSGKPTVEAVVIIPVPAKCLEEMSVKDIVSEVYESIESCMAQQIRIHQVNALADIMVIQNVYTGGLTPTMTRVPKV